MALDVEPHGLRLGVGDRRGKATQHTRLLARPGMGKSATVMALI
jgi:hypothetical protein